MKQLLLLTYASAQEVFLADQSALICQHWIDNTKWYNLQPIAPTSKDTPYFEVVGYDGEHILFNFCDVVVPKESQQCGYTDRLGYIVTSNKICSPLTPKIQDTTYKFTEIDNGVQLEFSNSEQTCPTSSGGYGLKITAYCDKSLSQGQSKDVKFLRQIPGTCIQEVSMNARNACPAFDANAFWTFAAKYWFIWGIIYIIIGAFINFFGRIMIKPTVFLTSFIVVTFAQLFILYSLFMHHERANWANWLVLAVCSIIGLLCAYLLVKSLKYGLALLGGGTGGALGLLVCGAFNISHPAAFWGILVALALIFTLITFKGSDQFMIFSTALFGSYMMVRGISLYAGGYPNEFEIMEEIKAGAIEKVPNSFYAYFAFIIVSVIGGSHHQWRQWKREAPGLKHPYHYL